MSHPAMTLRSSTTMSFAWLLPGGQGVVHGPPVPAQLCEVASKGADIRSKESTADVHGARHLAEVDALGRVLVVDDEVLVRRTLALFLTKAGFAAVGVEGGAEALDLLRTTGEAFDLLVTDQSMPGMTGCELIVAARDICPGLSAVLVSGYDMSGGEKLPAGVPLLRKPVGRAAFLGQVHALLGLASDEGGETA